MRDHPWHGATLSPPSAINGSVTAPAPTGLPPRHSPALPPFVDAAWLRANLADVVVADVRWQLQGPSGRDAYEAGHIPGAVFVDLDVDLADITTPDRGRHPLPSPEAFAAAMGALGIGDAAAVVAYDAAGGIFAARLAWMLRAIGRDAALLDGGLAAWGAPLEAGQGRARPAAAFTPVPWPAAALASIDEVASVSAAASGAAVAAAVPSGAADPAAGSVLIDARAPERYRGDAEPVDPRAGHIPGAVNAPCMAHLDPTGALLPPDALRDQFAIAGVSSADGSIAYCGSGVNACHALLVMEHAGLGRGRLFPGSWSAWSNQPDRPVSSPNQTSHDTALSSHDHTVTRPIT